MITQSKTDADKVKVSAETEQIVRKFVRIAATNLSEVVKGRQLEWEMHSQWERGTDGNFRERKKRSSSLMPVINDESLCALPDYQMCVDKLKSDMVVGPHLDRLVGTKMGCFRLDANMILKSLVYAMLDDEGHLTFTDERFDGEWQKRIELFGAEQVLFKTVAPLPHLVASDFPLRLNKDLVLDRMTDDEVTRCYDIGVLRPISLRFPLINGDFAVGIRRTMFLPKMIQKGDEPIAHPATDGEGSFGNRPLVRDDLVVDDVLSALRLFKDAQIRAAGYAQWSEVYWLKGGTSYRLLGQWPYWGKYELLPAEVPQLLALWQLLEEGASRFGFSIHRFNLAFDRGLLADRIVDLIIAAESLFLGDLGVQDRGELRFRFALRAAKFVEHPRYSEHDILRVMRRAYDARSAIVHGGTPSDTRLPDNNHADFPAFLDAIEGIVRLALRKALSMKEDGKKLRESEYWDSLVISNQSFTS